MALSAVIPRMVFTLHSIPRQQSAHTFVSSQRTRDALSFSSPLLATLRTTPTFHPDERLSLPREFHPLKTLRFGTRFLFTRIPSCYLCLRYRLSYSASLSV